MAGVVELKRRQTPRRDKRASRATQGICRFRQRASKTRASRRCITGNVCQAGVLTGSSGR
jgi:hypothetical protein